MITAALTEDGRGQSNLEEMATYLLGHWWLLEVSVLEDGHQSAWKRLPKESLVTVLGGHTPDVTLTHIPLETAGCVADSILQCYKRTTNGASALASTSLSRPPTCLGSRPIQSQQSQRSLMGSSSGPLPVTGLRDVTGPLG